MHIGLIFVFYFLRVSLLRIVNLLLFCILLQNVLKLKPGSEVKAKHDFKGTRADDLSFKKDDILVIVSGTRVRYFSKKICSLSLGFKIHKRKVTQVFHLC